jgi:hypothetical protein
MFINEFRLQTQYSFHYVHIVFIFISELYQEKPFVVKSLGEGQDQLVEATSTSARIPPAVVSLNLGGPDTEKDLTSLQTLEDEEAQSKYIGLIIGVLLTLISLLVAGIFFVVFRGRVQGKETPTHSLLATKIQDRLAASIDFKVSFTYAVAKCLLRVLKLTWTFFFN